MTTSQGQYIAELESTATKYISTPVSYRGGGHMLWAHVRERGALAKIGMALLVGLYWILVAAWCTPACS